MDMLYNCPGNRNTVVRRRTSSQLVKKHQTARRKVIQNISRLVLQTAEARKYLFMEGKDRLMVHLVRKYEQKIPAPEILVLNQTRARISEEVGISIKTLDRNIRKLEEMNLLTLNKGKIVITKAQYLQMKQDIDFYVNG